MLVTSSRSMNHITGPAPSPGSHHSPHHLSADLSPRSSNSSLVSSNESLLNASPSVPSPGLRDNGSSPRSGRDDGISALQCLENALGRSPFTLFSESETDNDHLQQHISKTFAILGSPDGGALACSPRLKSDSGESHDEDMERNERHLMPLPPSPIIKHQTIGTPNGSPTSSIGNGVLGSTIFQCPLCHVVYNSRHDFNEHIVTHSQQHACPKCTYITNIEDELHHHVQDIHGVEDYMEMFSDDEVVTPKTNAQGKLKTFKCKHCEYRAVTKKDFWDHTKSHIRQEKMLHCPKCPFVTEYKHHLEYHLRNHMGSKPYQCTKCSYSCVNKSMLNSHLKSHSNIYQYRCSDCSYATKYCHSLKLHLRKYNHSPAMVLNPDGTPNPLPIIDVYGTRRGPKMKRPDPILEGLATTQPLLPTSPQSNAFQTSLPKSQKGQRKTMSTPTKKEKAEKQRQRQLDARDMSPKPASSPRFISSMPNQPVTPPLKNNREDSSGDSDSDTRIPHHLAGRTQLPQAPISPSSIALILQRSNNNTLVESHHQKEVGSFTPSAVPNPLEIYNVAQYLLNPMLHMQGLNGLAQQLAKDQSTLLAHLLQQKNLPNQSIQPQEHTIDFSDRTRIIDASKRNLIVSSPLDLRNPKNEMPVFGGDESKRHKRKGKALRYERPSSSDNNEDDDDEALDFSNNNNNIHFKESNSRKIKAEGPTDLSVSAGNLLCRFCEISFLDRELYTIHMNFHSGGEDPFLCRCGKKTQNKIEFFKHLTTDPH